MAYTGHNFTGNYGAYFGFGHGAAGGLPAPQKSSARFKRVYGLRGGYRVKRIGYLPNDSPGH
jgi:hypothetical protein